MKLRETFVAGAQHATGGGDFDPLPAGWYSAQIVSADLTNTKAGTGQYVKCRYDITGPTHAGRVVFGNLNIYNPNPKAEEIARSQLNQICLAIGIAGVDDTDQLIGGNLMIKLTIRRSEQFGDSNDVKGFKAIEGSQPPAPAADASPAPAGSVSGNGGASAPPWAR